MVVTRRASAHVTIEFSDGSSWLTASARNALTAALTDTLDEGFPAGFNLAVLDHSQVIVRAWGGYANLVGTPEETRPDTVYDLASLSKVIATTTLALWLEDHKKWKLSQPVADWLPDFARRDITLQQLITHSSGIIAHRPFFHLGTRPAAIRRAVCEEAQLAVPSGRVLYSDLNFMLLGWAIEQCAAMPLDDLFSQVVTQPLAMHDTRYRPGARLRARCAATELDGDQRLHPGLVRGQVHDGNAWALGGVAGHAGLFSTASDLALFVEEFVDPRQHRLLSASSHARLARTQAGRQPDVRGLGWRLEPRGWGPWPEATIWHTGFTGTSLLISPRSHIGVVLLTNAIHPTRDLARQASFRARVHRAIARANP